MINASVQHSELGWTLRLPLAATGTKMRCGSEMRLQGPPGKLALEIFKKSVEA